MKSNCSHALVIVPIQLEALRTLLPAFVVRGHNSLPLPRQVGDLRVAGPQLLRVRASVCTSI